MLNKRRSPKVHKSDSIPYLSRMVDSIGFMYANSQAMNTKIASTIVKFSETDTRLGQLAGALHEGDDHFMIHVV